MRNRLIPIALAAALVVAAWARFPAEVRAELQMTNEEFKRLDPFEGHRLEAADKVFQQGINLQGRKKGDQADNKFEQAVAEYDAFLLEFPRSMALPYALYRKARSLHLADKRFAAIKFYKELLDFFPNRIRYAAAATVHMGRAYEQNGDVENALRIYGKLADDVDYSKQPIAAEAINRMADHYWQAGRRERAAKFYEQVAVDFRKRNEDAARHAIDRTRYYYVHDAPNEPKLREFYAAVQGFDRKPRKVEDPTEKDTRYWYWVRRMVHEYGDNFKEVEQDLQKRYYAYWADAMAGRFDGWDDYHIDRITFHYRADGNREAWMRALDEQFEQHQKKGDFDRIVKWIRVYSGHEDKVDEYFNKLDWSKMSNGAIFQLVRVFFDNVKNQELAKNTFNKIGFDEVDDRTRENWLNWLRHKRVDELVERLCQSFDDQLHGKARLLNYYNKFRNNLEKGEPLARELTSTERFAKDAWWDLAELYHRHNKHDEAIQAYRNADNPPDNLFRISEMYERQGKVTLAVNTLREVENFFHDHGAKAARQIAEVYEKAGAEKQMVSSLRKVLMKYPKSGQASWAHQKLEKMGIDPGGAVDDG